MPAPLRNSCERDKKEQENTMNEVNDLDTSSTRRKKQNTWSNHSGKVQTLFSPPLLLLPSTSFDRFERMYYKNKTNQLLISSTHIA